MDREPHGEYVRRLDARRAAAAKCESRHRQIGNLRLAVFLSAAAMAWFAFFRGAVSGWWLLAPLCGFMALMVWHSRVLAKLRRLRHAVDFYEKGLARLEERWKGTGAAGDLFRDPSHPYAEDLDLFGGGSLFELLCCARTHAGEELLASWLKSAAPAQVILLRQSAVDELRFKLDLREDLASLGTDVRVGIRPAPLIGWAQAPPRLNSGLLRLLSGLAAAATAASLAVWGMTGQHAWFFLMLLVELVFIYSQRKIVGQSVVGAEQAGRNLDLLALILGRLEREQFQTERLKDLRAALDKEGIPPSRLIRRLNFLIALLDSRKNALFAPLAFLLLWELQLAFLIENWRKKYGEAVAGWLSATAEFEALSSLAGYAFEHPDDPFPELSEQSPCFDGRGLGHPLLPESRCVRNDISLAGDMRILVVSGSNMSGKSTLLRTVGINGVLALAGAPVRARSLRISPLVVGASIRIVDSLQGGASRFYAEITRLRKLVALAEGPVPLLFLLDELLHGTNSHDRRIGSEAVVRGLARRGAIGLVTTHDLALADVVDALKPHASNVHFEDHIADGRIAFDYRLREGVVRKSNALELMRSVGLEV